MAAFRIRWNTLVRLASSSGVFVALGNSGMRRRLPVTRAAAGNDRVNYHPTADPVDCSTYRVRIVGDAGAGRGSEVSGLIRVHADGGAGTDECKVVGVEAELRDLTPSDPDRLTVTPRGFGRAAFCHLAGCASPSRASA